MTSDAGNLSNLRDIVVPDPVPWWPPAPGLALLMVLVLGVVVLVAWRSYRRYQRNAYRRAGLALLPVANSAYDVSVVLKRVALAAFPREEVASLHGEEWISFLNDTCPGQAFTADADLDHLKARAQTWIRHHRSLTTDH